MTETATRTNQQATVVSTAGGEASTRVQTVASVAEELTSAIGKISRQVAQSEDYRSGGVKCAPHRHHRTSARRWRTAD